MVKMSEGYYVFPVYSEALYDYYLVIIYCEALWGYYLVIPYSASFAWLLCSHTSW